MLPSVIKYLLFFFICLFYIFEKLYSILFLAHFNALINMEKWIGLLCANVFILLKTTLAYTVFNFTLTFSLGANNLSHNVTLSINKRVKEILTWSWY